MHAFREGDVDRTKRRDRLGPPRVGPQRVELGPGAEAGEETGRDVELAFVTQAARGADERHRNDDGRSLRPRRARGEREGGSQDPRSAAHLGKRFRCDSELLR